MLIGGAFSHSGMSNEPLCTCLIGTQGSLRELSWKPFGCLTSYKALSSSQLQSRDFRFCIMDPECRMVVHVCCQKIRHGWILIWKQTSFGLTVFLEHCLVEEALKSKCCRFCNLHCACSDQRLYFDPTVDFMFVCVPHTKASVWCDTDKPKWFKGLQWNLQKNVDRLWKQSPGKTKRSTIIARDGLQW